MHEIFPRNHSLISSDIFVSCIQTLVTPLDKKTSKKQNKTKQNKNKNKQKQNKTKLPYNTMRINSSSLICNVVHLFVLIEHYIASGSILVIAIVTVKDIESYVGKCIFSI